MYTLLGVDVSKDSLTIAHPDLDKPELPFKRWPVEKIALDKPEWWQHFNALLAPGCIVVAEPTGWHYLAPVATALKHWSPSAQLWLITHQAAAELRSTHIASQKTDAMDARALALVAYLIATDNTPRHTRQYNHDLEEQVTVLRLYVNTRARLVKQATRTMNQLDAFGHAIWPELNYRKTTWHNLIEQGIVTPLQIKAFAATLRPSEEINSQAIRYIKSLAAALPDIEPPIAAVITVQRLLDQLRQVTREQNEVESAIHAIIHAYPFAEVTRRWETIPQSSAESIAALHVATHGLAEHTTPDEFKAAVGTFPQLEQSGKINKSRATKKGYRPAINAVYMWATRLTGPSAPDNPIRRYHQKKGDFPATKSKLARLLSGVARTPAGYQFNPPQEEPHEN